MQITMQINLTYEQIREYAGQHVNEADRALGAKMKKAARRGWMKQEDLRMVAGWKWRGGRTQQLCEQNTQSEVREITRVSFVAESERLRIGALLALRGAQWPMASVILHFAFPDRYPILDVRAMNAVGGPTHYTFERWLEYVELCRATAQEHRITMRTLDRALWAFGRNAP